MAGDISYTNVSGNTYRFTIRTFTNISGTTADRCELILYFGDGDSVAVPRANGPSGVCAPAFDGVIIGSCTGTLKHNVYIAEHTYLSPGTYMLSVNDPNRSAGINNIAASAATPFHLEASLVINPFFGANSSPSYTNIPVVCSPVYSFYNYNPAASDTDGDSLYYENFLRGTTGYSDPAASSSFYIDSLSGDVVWDQPTTIGNYVYDIRITEWRNIGGTYYQVGSSMQEVWNAVTAGTAGLDESAYTPAISVYPNPSPGTVHFKMESTRNSTGLLCITNSTGGLIKTIEITGDPELSVSLGNLSAGMYFYRLVSPDKITIQGKFVILAEIR